MAKYMSRVMVMVSGGLFFYKHDRINKDYTKYLGPDWKPTFEGASSYVSNHSCWLDILICNFAKDFPIFTPKSGIKKWPVVGTIAEDACEAYFINRAGTKEEREQLVIDLGKKQEECEKGLSRPLILYPEGCTTNNSGLIQFRRGAFFGLHSVQPMTIKYYSPYFNPSHDVIDVLAQAILLMCQPYSTAHIKELPVFKPNEYFFKHHLQPGEEKWHAYMRVVREMMGETLGVPLSDERLEDKFDYKNILYPGKGTKNKSE